ncbi:MAG: MFS transporter [Bacillota bacterium]|nr:MFS transporter [Bacillota bacterium]
MNSIKRLFHPYIGLPRSIYSLFFVQIINRFGDFVFPFLSLLLTEKLKLSFGLTGTIVMMASLISIPASLLGGKYADQFSRKKTYLFGQSLAAFCILACGFINIPFLIVTLLILSAFFNGFVRPTISAIMTDNLSPEKRQVGSSLLYLGINIGVSVGPMVAGFLFNNFLPLLFIGDAATSFVAVAIVIIFIQDTKPVHGNVKGINLHEKEEHVNLIQALFKRPRILVFLLINIAYSFAYRQTTFTLPMMMNKVFKENGSGNFGYLMSVNALTVLLLTFIIIGITRRFKTLSNMISAGLFYAIGFGMIGIIRGNFELYIFSTILWTIGEILSATNKGVYIANNSPKNFRARFSSVDNLTSSIGSALGTYLIGRFLDHHAIEQVWTLIFVVVLMGTCLMAILRLYGKRNVVTREMDRAV